MERAHVLSDFINYFLLLFNFIPQPGQLLLVGFPVTLHLLLQRLLQRAKTRAGHDRDTRQHTAQRHQPASGFDSLEPRLLNRGDAGTRLLSSYDYNTASAHPGIQSRQSLAADGRPLLLTFSQTLPRVEARVLVPGMTLFSPLPYYFTSSFTKKIRVQLYLGEKKNPNQPPPLQTAYPRPCLLNSRAKHIPRRQTPSIPSAC